MAEYHLASPETGGGGGGGWGGASPDAAAAFLDSGEMPPEQPRQNPYVRQDFFSAPPPEARPPPEATRPTPQYQRAPDPEPDMEPEPMQPRREMDSPPHEYLDTSPRRRSTVKDYSRQVSKKMGKFFGVSDDYSVQRWHAAVAATDDPAGEGQTMTPLSRMLTRKVSRLSMKKSSVSSLEPVEPAAPAVAMRPMENYNQTGGGPGPAVKQDWFGGDNNFMKERAQSPDGQRAPPVQQRAVAAPPQRSNQGRAPMLQSPGNRNNNNNNNNGGGRAGPRIAASDDRPIGLRPDAVYKLDRNQQSKLDTSVLKQLNEIYEHRPYFTYWVVTIEIVVMIIALAVHGFAPIAFNTSIKKGSTFTQDNTPIVAEYKEPSNFWIGLKPTDLVALGALFAPCMREDTRVTDEIINPQLEAEKSFGCCSQLSVPNGGVCYSSASGDCDVDSLKVFSAGYTCGGKQCCTDFDPLTNTSATYPKCTDQPDSSFVSCTCTVLARPCCLGVVGKCELQTEDYCNFKDGLWHSDKELCSEVNCLEDTCGLVKFLTDKPDQWYRIYLSLLLHAGVIHLVFVLLFQYSVMLDIERLCGFVRMFFIYVISGIGGNLAGVLLTPYQVNTGAFPACYGLMACLVVELGQSWQLLESPCSQLFKLIAMIAFALALGFLPYINNWADSFGFLLGVLSSLVFLPYITFGKWDAVRKRFLLVVGLAGIIAYMIIGFSLFYTNKFNNCEWCQKYDCVDFSANFCNDNAADELSREI